MDTTEQDNTINIEGFYFWFAKRGDERLRRYFLPVIGRLARADPNFDPQIIIEKLSEALFEYRKELHSIQKGDGSTYEQDRKYKKEIEHSERRVKADYIERQYDSGVDFREAEREAKQRTSSARVPRSNDPPFSVFG